MIFSEGVAGGQEKSRFNKQESWIGPTDLALGLDADSMANPGDGAGYKHVRIKLVVPVVYFNKEVESIHFARKL